MSSRNHRKSPRLVGKSEICSDFPPQLNSFSPEVLAAISSIKVSKDTFNFSEGDSEKYTSGVALCFGDLINRSCQELQKSLPKVIFVENLRKLGSKNCCRFFKLYAKANRKNLYLGEKYVDASRPSCPFFLQWIYFWSLNFSSFQNLDTLHNNLSYALQIKLLGQVGSFELDEQWSWILFKN